MNADERRLIGVTVVVGEGFGFAGTLFLRVRIPNGERAVVELTKLTGYCLSTSHPLGCHKARAFRSALGITVADASLVRDELLRRVVFETAELDREDEYGVRYVLDFPMVHKSRTAIVRSLWMARRGEDFPRLVTCYVR